MGKAESCRREADRYEVLARKVENMPVGEPWEEALWYLALGHMR